MNLNIHPQLPERRDWRIGCIGAGFIMSDCHLPNYTKVGYIPHAISSRTLKNAQAVADNFNIPNVYDSNTALMDNKEVEVLDIAVPPQDQLAVIKEAVKRDHIKGILAQKPLGADFAEAQEIVRLSKDAGKVLVVNQNMRYDQSMRALKTLISEGKIGETVLGTIDMRAIPHWAPWQEDLGWLTLRIMSIHHLDISRFLFGDPVKVYCSTTRDPRTKFAHTDGICLTTLEYENGARFQINDDVWAGPAREGAAEDCFVRWRVEGTEGLAKGEIGWPKWPEVTPSTLTYSTTASKEWISPEWPEAWFPDAFLGPMSELLCALEGEKPEVSGQSNLRTMLLVEACYMSAEQGQVINFKELCKEYGV
ncbi:MAG: Gfo/Idh/MocA family oxidoreductase [Lentisphaeraceae bacterium]|nr:Gfo/Idh/MocA family oxidoreductase [Lentisphaeraceae bacterium]